MARACYAGDDGRNRLSDRWLTAGEKGLERFRELRRFPLHFLQLVRALQEKNLATPSDFKKGTCSKVWI